MLQSYMNKLNKYVNYEYNSLFPIPITPYHAVAYISSYTPDTEWSK